MEGVWFGSIHSFRHLNLILAPFTPTPAEPQTNFLKVPGRDGFLDLTEANGEIKFNSREFLFTFTIAQGDTLSFDERVSKVSSELNGKRCNIILDREPDYFWFGRCQINKYAQDRNIGQIVVKAIVDPYKLKAERTYVDVKLTSQDEARTVTLQNNGRMTVIPSFDVSNVKSKVVVVFNNKSFELRNGAQRFTDIYFVKGENTLQFTGVADVTIHWQEGEL